MYDIQGINHLYIIILDFLYFFFIESFFNIFSFEDPVYKFIVPEVVVCIIKIFYILVTNFFYCFEFFHFFCTIYFISFTFIDESRIYIYIFHSGV